MVFVQEPPSDIRNEITVCRNDKIAKADTGLLFGLQLIGSNADITKNTMVHYEVKNQRKCTYHGVSHSVIIIPLKYEVPRYTFYSLAGFRSTTQIINA